MSRGIFKYHLLPYYVNKHNVTDYKYEYDNVSNIVKINDMYIKNCVPIDLKYVNFANIIEIKMDDIIKLRALLIRNYRMSFIIQTIFFILSAIFCIPLIIYNYIIIGLIPISFSVFITMVQIYLYFHVKKTFINTNTSNYNISINSDGFLELYVQNDIYIKFVMSTTSNIYFYYNTDPDISKKIELKIINSTQ